MSDNESSAKRRKTNDLEDSKADSLSIEETNKLRAKLGLAPLEATSDQPADDGKKILINSTLMCSLSVQVKNEVID